MNEEKKEPTIVEAKNENVISQYDEVQVAKKVERTDSFKVCKAQATTASSEVRLSIIDLPSLII